MAREFSAGGVVLRQVGDAWHIAAIRPRRERDPGGKKHKPVLALPKGIVDPGEKPEFTAEREIREETGVAAQLVTKLGDVKYMYVRSWSDGERVFKIVSFYLFLYTSGELGDIAPEMRHEVEAAEWLPLDDAARKLAYKGEREMVAKAQEYLRSHPEFAVAAP